MPALQTITLDVTGDAQLERTLVRFSERVHNMRPVWDKLTNDFLKIERRQFASQGAYASGGWAPLSPRYAAWKARHYPGRPILVRSNDLKKSLTRKPLDVQRYTGLSMEVGTRVPYAQFHQHGTTKMPRRRPVELTEADRHRWVQTVQRYILTGRTE